MHAQRQGVGMVRGRHSRTEGAPGGDGKLQKWVQAFKWPKGSFQCSSNMEQPHCLFQQRRCGAAKRGGALLPRNSCQGSHPQVAGPGVQGRGCTCCPAAPLPDDGTCWLATNTCKQSWRPGWQNASQDCAVPCTTPLPLFPPTPNPHTHKHTHACPTHAPNTRHCAAVRHTSAGMP